MATAAQVDPLDCPICLDVFQDPVALKCGHSLCRRCLNQLVNQHGKNKVICPECRTTDVLKHVKNVEEMGTNFRLRDVIELIETERLKSKSIKSKCPNCSEVNVMIFCEHCSILLCNDCRNGHGREIGESVFKDMITNIRQIEEHIGDLDPAIIALKKFAKTKAEKEDVSNKIKYKCELKESASKLKELSNKLNDARVLKFEEIMTIAADYQMMRINLDEEECLSPDHQGPDELFQESSREKEKTHKVLTNNIDPDEQKKLIYQYMKTPLKAGETWYLVDIKWYKKWKKYVGFDAWDTSSVGDEIVYPGPVDNTPLFKDNTNELRKEMLDELDYMVFPEDGWNCLVAWYGLSQGNQTVPRKVIEQGLFVKQCKFEVYLMELKLCENSNMDNVIIKEFSKADTIQYIENEMKNIFNIPNSKNVRLWNKYRSNTLEHLNRMDISTLDAGFYSGQTIIIEEQNKDGSWPRQNPGTIIGLNK